MRKIAPVLALAIFSAVPALAQIKKTKHMEKAPATSKVTTFNFGAASDQARQTLKNIDRVLAGFHVTKSNIAEMVIYLTNPREQSAPLAPLLQEYMGQHRPAGTVIGVTGLWYPKICL